MKTIRKELLPVACLLAVALAAIGDGIYIIVHYEGKIGTAQAGGYLVLLGSFLAALNIALLIKGGKAAPQGEPTHRESSRPIVIALALLVGYALFFDVLGYLLSTCLFLVVYLRVFGSYRWVPVLAGAVAAAAGSAYMWSAVGLTLPQGVVPWP